MAERSSIVEALVAAQDEGGELAPAPVPEAAGATSLAREATAVLDQYFDELSDGPRYSSDWNRASGLHDQCDRRLVYKRTSAASHAEGFSAWTHQIFEDGKMQEKAWKQRLLAAGFDVEESQQALEWPEPRIRGHIDGVLVFPSGERCVYEVKRLDANAWRGIKQWQDFRDGMYYTHYPAQLALYLLMRGEGRGVFLITAQGHYKFLDFDLDDDDALEYAEEALAQAERVNAHVDAKTLPERIMDLRVCTTCAFAGLCLPDIEWGERDGDAVVVENEALETALETRAALDDARKQWDKADKLVKASFRNKPLVHCGNWRISGKGTVAQRVDTKAMPDDLKEPYMVETQTWRAKIEKRDV